MLKIWPFIIIMIFSNLLFSQKGKNEFCAADNLHLNLLKIDSKYAIRDALIKKNYVKWVSERNSTTNKTTSFDPVTLPVVFHDLTSAQDIYTNSSLIPSVVSALNDNFLNPANINFCIALINNQGASFTTSFATGGPVTLDNNNQSQITAVSNLIQNLGSFPTTEYINIYIVDDIAGSVAGFAYGPAAHGASFDGIYIEKQYIVNFNTNNNILVLTHEMGHYLGLLHTFGICQPIFQACSCNNNNCLLDGDMVCDTPPDYSISANGVENTCNTDGDFDPLDLLTQQINPFSAINNSGTAQDVDDFINNYMDYGNWSIQNSFTDGQAVLMRNMIDPSVGPRNSLLNSNVCNIACDIGSSCSIAIGTIPTIQILGVSYPNTLVLNGTSVSHTFNATITNCTGLNDYAWQVTNLDTNTIIITGGNNTSFTASFLQTGNYQISFTASVANSNPLCFETTTLNIQVVLPASNGGTGNCIDIDWSNSAFQRISYTGGWVHADNNPASNIMRDASSSGPVFVTTPNNTANNSPFAIINGSIPNSDPTFGGMLLPNGINNVFRVGRVIDGNNINNPLPNGAADYVTYTFTPSAGNSKIRVYYLGLREQMSVNVNNSLFSFHNASNGQLSNGFGMVSSSIRNSNLLGRTHNYSLYYGEEFNNFLFENYISNSNTALTPRSNITIAGIGYSKTNNWGYYDLDLSYYACLGESVTLTFYARTSTAVAATNNSYAYFGLQCLPSVPPSPITFDLPNVKINCTAQSGVSCYTFSTPIQGANLIPNNLGQHLPHIFKKMEVATSFDGINYSTFNYLSAWQNYNNDPELHFQLCKESDTNPFKYFKVRYTTPCHTYEDVITLHQGFTHMVDPCPSTPSTTPRGGTIPASYNGNNLIIISKCQSTTITLNKPCWWQPGMQIEYQWQIFMGTWQNIGALQNGTNEDLLIDASNINSFPIGSSACRKLRRIAKFEDPYCKTPVWFPSEEFTLENLHMASPFPLSTQQNDVCLGDEVNLSASLFSFGGNNVNSCLDQNIQNSTTVSFTINGAPIIGTFKDANGTILAQNVTSYTYFYLAQNFPQIYFSFVNVNSNDYNVTLNLNSNIYGCDYTNINTPFAINVKPSSIAGAIQMELCSNPPNFTTINIDNNNNLGYQWQYSYDNLTFYPFSNSNAANFSIPTGFIFTSFPVFVRRMAYGSQDCPNVGYSNVISFDDNYNIPTFTQVSAICVGEPIAALPTTSINGITGTWSPALNNTATTTYTFTPNTNQCAATTMTITVTSVTPTFTQVPAICEGATLAALPTTSLEGITGTWSPALNNTATTTYTFTPDINQCAVATTMIITVNPIVNPTFIQVPAICEGATLAALPTTSLEGITGTWSPAINNTATTTYTFTPDINQCAVVTTMNITVNPNLTPTFMQVPAICTGTALAALPTTSLEGITGTWSPALNNTTTTTYTFTPDINQCSLATTMTITVNSCGEQCPTLTASNSSICSGQSILLTVQSGGASTYTVQPGNIVLTTGVPQLVSPPAGATTYSIAAMGNCPTTSVTVTTLITTPALTVIASDTIICLGELITLTPTGLPAGTLYTLLPDNITGTGPFTVSPTSTMNYSILTFIDCCPVSSDIYISVEQCDTPCEVKADFIYDYENCILTNTSIAGVGTIIASFEWTITDVGGNVVYQNTTNPTLNLNSILPNGFYNVCLTVYGSTPSGSECAEDKFCYQINANCGELPCEIKPDFIYDEENCTLTNTSVAGVGTTIVSFTWTITDVGGNIVYQNTTNPTLNLNSILPNGVYKVCLLVYGNTPNGGECKDKFCLEINVNCGELPCEIKPDFIYDEENCTLTNTSVAGFGTTIVSFKWTITDVGGNIVYQNTTNPTLNLNSILPNGVYKVCLLVYGNTPNGGECKDEFCLEINVNCGELPCEVKPDFIYDEENCILTNTSVASVGTVIASFEWTITDVGGNVVYQNTTNPTLNLNSILPSGIYNVCLTVYGSTPNGSECAEDKFCLQINVNCEKLNSELFNPIIYPNPNTGNQIIIEKLGTIKSVRLIVTDINGKLILNTVKSTDKGNIKFRLNVPEAMYHVYIEDIENNKRNSNFKLLIVNK